MKFNIGEYDEEEDDFVWEAVSHPMEQFPSRVFELLGFQPKDEGTAMRLLAEKGYRVHTYL